MQVYNIVKFTYITCKGAYSKRNHALIFLINYVTEKIIFLLIIFLVIHKPN